MHPVPKPDRRSPSRPLDPSTCPECHALATPALFRTDTAVYYHCGRCAYLWCIQKPVQTINNVPVFRHFDWGSFPNEEKASNATGRAHAPFPASARPSRSARPDQSAPAAIAAGCR